MEICTNPDILRVIYFAKIIISVIFTIIPIGIIVMVTFDFCKKFFSAKENTNKDDLNLAVKRIGYGIFIFLIPFIVARIVGIIEIVFEKSLNYNSCIENADSDIISFYQSIYDMEEEREKILQDQEIQKLLAEEEEFKDLSDTLKDSTATGEQSRIGAKYNLSERQLERLATIAQKEQETVKGAEAEACLMANRFELFGSNNGTGAEGLYNYVFTSGWWGDAEKKVNKYLSNNKLREEIKAVVKNVLVNGDRSELPLYVDEHDCWNCNPEKYCSGGFKGDICLLRNKDGEYSKLADIKNRANYIKNETIIYNVYGDNRNFYTFYSFPASNSDPFGYTNSALNKYKELNKGG